MRTSVAALVFCYREPGFDRTAQQGVTEDHFSIAAFVRGGFPGENTQ